MTVSRALRWAYLCFSYMRTNNRICESCLKPQKCTRVKGVLRMPHSTRRHEVRSAEPIYPGVQSPHWEPSYLAPAGEHYRGICAGGCTCCRAGPMSVSIRYTSAEGALVQVEKQ